MPIFPSHTWLVPVEARRGHPFPWNRIYRWLRVFMWVLGSEFRSSVNEKKMKRKGAYLLLDMVEEEI